MKNDATLFMRADQVEAAWQLLMPVLEAVAGHGTERFSQLRRRHLGTGETQGLLAQGHVGPCRPNWWDSVKKKGKNS